MTQAAQNTVAVGDQVYYKTSKTRGRPYVGTVIRKMGIFTEIENKGEIIRVPSKLIKGTYTFRNYNTKARIAAAQAEAEQLELEAQIAAMENEG